MARATKISGGARNAALAPERRNLSLPSPSDHTRTPSRPPLEEPAPNLRLILGGLILAMVLAALDQSIVNTALPSMAGDLGGLAHMSWVVTAFMLSSTIATPIYGKLSDMYGRRRFLLFAICVFLIMSGLCGIAQSMGQLIAFRLLQGLGAGGIMTLTQATISDVVTPRERVRYQGLFTGAFAFSSVTGPLLGGALTTALSWRWVFYINLPLGILAIALLWCALPPSVSRKRHQIDLAGAFAMICAASSLLLLFSLGGSLFAWHSFEAAGLGSLALVGTALFIAIERRAAEPILSLSLFGIRNFAIGTVTTGCMSFAMMSAMVFLPLYFQLVLGLSPARSGAMLLPQIGAMLLTSVFGGQLSSRIGRPKMFMVLGILLEASGLGLLGILAIGQASLPWFLGALGILGLGMGIAMPHATVIIQHSAPRQRMGEATATMAFLRSLGGALGVAVSGGVMVSGLHRDLAALHAPIDVKAIVDGGMAAVAQLPPALQPAIVDAFRAAISTSFAIGGSVMLFALVLAFALRAVRFED